VNAKPATSTAEESLPGGQPGGDPLPTGSQAPAPVIDPDTEDVRLVAEGDQAAARRLMQRHLPRMLRLARRMLNDESEAEDVAQELFLRVWRHAAAWQPGSAKFETWMHRVAMNLCYDRLRKRRETTMDEMPEREDEAPGPAGILHAAQVSGRVGQAMAALPERQRAAIVLCHYQGLSNAEAADLLDVSVDALESLLARGRRGLKKILSAEAPDLLGTV